MKISATPSLALIAAAAAISVSAQAAQYVYPQKGQDSATQSRDEADCSAWAIQQTGFDPAKAPAAVAPAAPTSAVTGAPGGLSAGAATAALSALGGGGGGLGGAAGLATGALGGGGGGLGGVAGAAGLLNQAVRPQAVAQAQPQPSAGQAAFEQARAACLTGKGYSVR